MKTYTYYYTETNYGVISVEAESDEQAYDLAVESANAGLVSWGDSETEFELTTDFDDEEQN